MHRFSGSICPRSLFPSFINSSKTLKFLVFCGMPPLFASPIGFNAPDPAAPFLFYQQPHCRDRALDWFMSP
jgi:hypothetical protein